MMLAVFLPFLFSFIDCLEINNLDDLNTKEVAQGSSENVITAQPRAGSSEQKVSSEIKESDTVNKDFDCFIRLCGLFICMPIFFLMVLLFQFFVEDIAKESKKKQRNPNLH
ncbi:hypothetical protein NGRA_1754 [Nosema granulosis]|uniref:Transmembrane protein n=1 Tax=Nosema granulosis TaxID=83296 RepID=A0A9P6GXU9_9MICR|nr:hypothetical protein NGRA_1754 [Nosema granulosis]